MATSRLGQPITAHRPTGPHVTDGWGCLVWAGGRQTGTRVEGDGHARVRGRRDRCHRAAAGAAPMSTNAGPATRVVGPCGREGPSKMQIISSEWTTLTSRLEQRPHRSAGWCARQRLRSVAIEARPTLRGSAQIDHEAGRQEVTGVGCLSRIGPVVCAGGTPSASGPGGGFARPANGNADGAGRMCAICWRA
jgi:hypothetical protein